jgi:cobalt-precorrin-5B (C1)-methyltransferase
MKHPNPDSITRDSFGIIRDRLGPVSHLSEEDLSIVIRIAHTTGDVEFAKTFRITDGAIRSAVAAVRLGCDVVTDVEMVRTGIRKPKLEAFGGEVRCFLNDPDVVRRAKEEDTTRSAVAMRTAAPYLDGAVVAIGNAPTALYELLSMIEEGDVRPALVVGVPVGFVGAQDSKEALARVNIPQVTVLSERGGSTIAAAIVNGILALAEEGGPADYRSQLEAVNGLRRGITTGTCAQAAAKAAAMAIAGETVGTVEVELPRSNRPYSGRRIGVPVASVWVENRVGTAKVIKDAGDDADVTDGTAIVATVRLREEPGIAIRGGLGVGRVTLPGLPVPVGEAAINPVPARMIRRELEALAPKGGGFDVEISVPAGEELARKTWNPRLGIEGGISIIGTGGVVEPKSSDAFVRSFGAHILAARKRGYRRIVVTPGYVGEKYLFETVGVPEGLVVTVGDHIGEALDRCVSAEFEEVMLVGHIGKLAKVAAGMFNTHSMYGDARLETIAAAAAACGASPEAVRTLLSTKMAEAAIGVVRDAGAEEAFAFIAERIVERCRTRVKEGVGLGCVLLALDATPLAIRPQAFREREAWNRFS